MWFASLAIVPLVTASATPGELASRATMASGNGPCQPAWLPWFGGQQGSVNGGVSALALSEAEGLLYVGGGFTAAGGSPAASVAAWDGESWAALDTGLNGPVFGMAVMPAHDGAPASVVVVGFFTMAGGRPARGVARWDGSGWSDLGGGIDGWGWADSVIVFDDGLGAGPALYVGGWFNAVGGVPAKNIARWDGTSWSALADGVPFETFGMTSLRTQSGVDVLCVGGSSSTIGVWDGLAWSSISIGDDQGFVMALSSFDDGSGSGPALIVGGGFTIPGEPTSWLARWNGSDWTPLGAGVNGWVASLLAVDDGLGAGQSLYVGGNFTTADGEPAARAARWDGQSWFPLGEGCAAPVRTLALGVGERGEPLSLVAGGDFAQGPAGDPFLGLWQMCPNTPMCTGDLNSDGEVGGADLAALLGAWGGPGADLDGDGTTNASDLATLLGGWGPCQ